MVDADADRWGRQAEEVHSGKKTHTFVHERGEQEGGEGVMGHGEDRKGGGSEELQLGAQEPSVHAGHQHRQLARPCHALRSVTPSSAYLQEVPRFPSLKTPV